MTDYVDYRIRCPSEAAAKAAARAAEPGFVLLDGDGAWITGSHRHALDPIGTLYNDDAVTDPETGDIETPATPKDGWYANLRVVADIAPEVQTLLVAAGMALDQDTGRVWL